MRTVGCMNKLSSIYLVSLKSKVVPFQFNTAFKDNKCSFCWSNICQPSSKTQENCKLLCEIVNEQLKRHKSLKDRGPNASATDCGSTESAHIAQMRLIYKLLLWIKDPSHSVDTIIKTTMQRVYGITTLSFGSQNYILSLLPAVLKHTIKLVEKNNKYKQSILEYSQPKEYINAPSNSNTRFRSNIKSAECFFHKNKLKNDSDGCALKLLTQLSNELEHQDECRLISTISDNISKINSMEESKESEDCDLDAITQSTINPESLSLPFLSDPENINYDGDIDHTAILQSLTQSSSASGTASVQPSQITTDSQSHEAQASPLQQHTHTKTMLDLSKHVIILQQITKDDAFVKTNKSNGKKLIEFWSKRPCIASLIILFCIGNLISVPLIDLMEKHYNRWIEFIPMIGSKLQQIQELKQIIKSKIEAYTLDDVKQALQLIKDNYSFKEKKLCERLVNASSGNIAMCSQKHLKNHRTCATHKRNYKSQKLNLMVPLLPSKIDQSTQDHFKQIFKGIFNFKDPLGSPELPQKCRKYFNPLLTYLNSDIFNKYDQIDGFDTNVAKCWIWMDAWRFMIYYEYKFMERMRAYLELGIGLAPMLRHPKFGIRFAKNVKDCGKKKCQQRSAAHLKLKENEFSNILRKELNSGYKGGMSYLSSELFGLISSFADEKEWSIIMEPKYSALWSYVESNVLALITTIPIERFNKRCHKLFQQQTISTSTINNNIWPSINLRNSLHHHPIKFSFLCFGL